MSSEVALEKSSRRIRAWVVSLRAPFLTASALPALVGAFAAYWKTGSFSVPRFLLSFFGVLFIHLGANLANDFFDDLSGCDRINQQPTPFSGGSRVIQQNLLPRSVVLFSSLVFLVAGTAQGLVLNNLLPGNIILKLGLIGLALGFLYTAPPLKLSYRGLGELGVLIAFGPLLVLGTFASQTGFLDRFAVLAGLPAGLLVASILLINEVLDEKWDRLAGKRNLVVLIGHRAGFRVYLVSFLAAYVAIAIGIGVGVFPHLAFLGFLPLLAYFMAFPRKAVFGDKQALIKLSAMTIASQTASTGLVALSYLLTGPV